MKPNARWLSAGRGILPMYSLNGKAGNMISRNPYAGFVGVINDLAQRKGLR